MNNNISIFSGISHDFNAPIFTIIGIGIVILCFTFSLLTVKYPQETFTLLNNWSQYHFNLSNK